MKEKLKQDLSISEEQFTEDEILFREFATKAFVARSSANKIMKKISSMPAPKRQSDKASFLDILFSMWNNWGRKLAPAFAVFLCAAIISFCYFTKNKPTERKSVSLISITALSSEAVADGKQVEGTFLSGMDLSLMQPVSLDGNFEINIEGIETANLVVKGKMQLLPIVLSNKAEGLNIKGENADVKVNNTKNIRILVNDKDFMLKSDDNKKKISKKKNKAGVLLASDTNYISKESIEEKAANIPQKEEIKGPRLTGRIKSLPNQVSKEEIEESISSQTEDITYPEETEGDLEYESPFEVETIILGE